MDEYQPGAVVLRLRAEREEAMEDMNEEQAHKFVRRAMKEAFKDAKINCYKMAEDVLENYGVLTFEIAGFKKTLRIDWTLTETPDTTEDDQ